MTYFHPAWLEARRRRFTRPDGQRWIRPDAARFRKPAPYTQQSTALSPDDLELAAERAVLLHLRSDIAALRAELKFRRMLRDSKAGFDPSQPRVPAGNPDGGQWTLVGGGINDPRVISDASPDPIEPGAQYAAADGHHHVPRGVFENKEYSFRPETLKVLEDAKTGPLKDPSSNRYDRVHRELNDAVKEKMDRYLERNKIQSNQMTPAQAREFVEEIKSSHDPRIQRFYYRMLYREWRYWFRRVPRGID